MKKSITAVLVLAFLAFTTSTFANNNNRKNDQVNERIESSFRKEFANAEKTSWSKVNEFYKAQFTINGQVMFAFLNSEGQVVGICRNVLSTQLPIQLMTELKNEYADYWISELFEMVQDNQTSYYVTIENANHKIVLKSEGSDSWTEFSRTRK